MYGRRYFSLLVGLGWELEKMMTTTWVEIVITISKAIRKLLLFIFVHFCTLIVILIATGVVFDKMSSFPQILNQFLDDLLRL